MSEPEPEYYAGCFEDDKRQHIGLLTGKQVKAATVAELNEDIRIEFTDGFILTVEAGIAGDEYDATPYLAIVVTEKDGRLVFRSGSY